MSGKLRSPVLQDDERFALMKVRLTCNCNLFDVSPPKLFERAKYGKVRLLIRKLVDSLLLALSITFSNHDF